MLWREMALVKNGKVGSAEHAHPFVPDLEKVKRHGGKFLKKTAHTAIYVSIKSYLLFKRFIKEKSKLIFKKLASLIKKESENISEEFVKEKKEVSKYLRVISDYRQKIRKVKEEIKEEEGIE